MHQCWRIFPRSTSRGSHSCAMMSLMFQAEYKVAELPHPSFSSLLQLFRACCQLVPSANELLVVLIFASLGPLLLFHYLSFRLSVDFELRLILGGSFKPCSRCQSQCPRAILTHCSKRLDKVTSGTCLMCLGFKIRTKKQREEHLRYILMEAALCPASEPPLWIEGVPQSLHPRVSLVLPVDRQEEIPLTRAVFKEVTMHRVPSASEAEKKEDNFMSKYTVRDSSISEANHFSIEGRVHPLAPCFPLSHFSGSQSRSVDFSSCARTGEGGCFVGTNSGATTLAYSRAKAHFSTSHPGGLHNFIGSAEPLCSALTDHSDRHHFAGAVAHVGFHIGGLLRYQ